MELFLRHEFVNRYNRDEYEKTDTRQLVGENEKLWEK
jgi:hypothetical protein